MTIDERFGWLLIGCMIGLLLGYSVRILEDVADNSKFWMNGPERFTSRHSDQRGVMHTRLYGNVALLLVVAITVWAAVVSQRASDDVREVQDRMGQILECNQNVFARALDVLNDRTTYSTDQLDANLDLQIAQSNMIEAILLEDPPTAGTYERESELYLEKLLVFIGATQKSKTTRDTKPYPKAEDIERCVERVED